MPSRSKGRLELVDLLEAFREELRKRHSDCQLASQRYEECEAEAEVKGETSTRAFNKALEAYGKVARKHIPPIEARCRDIKLAQPMLRLRSYDGVTNLIICNDPKIQENLLGESYDPRAHRATHEMIVVFDPESHRHHLCANEVTTFGPLDYSVGLLIDTLERGPLPQTDPEEKRLRRNKICEFGSESRVKQLIQNWQEDGRGYRFMQHSKFMRGYARAFLIDDDYALTLIEKTLVVPDGGKHALKTLEDAIDAVADRILSGQMVLCGDEKFWIRSLAIGIWNPPHFQWQYELPEKVEEWAVAEGIIPPSPRMRAALEFERLLHREDGPHSTKGLGEESLESVRTPASHFAKPRELTVLEAARLIVSETLELRGEVGKSNLLDNEISNVSKACNTGRLTSVGHGARRRVTYDDKFRLYIVRRKEQILKASDNSVKSDRKRQGNSIHEAHIQPRM